MGQVPDVAAQVRPCRRSTLWWRTRLLAHGGALQHPPPVVDHGTESGGCHLYHPASGLQRTESASGHLLGLNLRQPVAGPVGRVQDDLGAVVHGVTGAVVEEHLPRDGHSEPADRGVQHRRAGTRSQVPRREHVCRHQFDQAPQRDVFAEWNRP